MKNRFLETEAGQEKVQTDRRRQVSDLKISKKNNAEMQWIHAKLGSDRKNQRHNDNDGRENIHHHSDEKKKYIQNQEKCNSAVDIRSDGQFHVSIHEDYDDKHIECSDGG